MSIPEFTALLKSKVYTSWLKSLDKNIITNTVQELRSSRQTASRTDFVITKDTVRDIFVTITGKTPPPVETELFLRRLLELSGSKTGKFIKVAGTNAVKFENIAFDTISNNLKAVLDEYDEIAEAYSDARDQYEKTEKAALLQNTKLSAKERNKEFAKIEADAKKISFGTYFHKGHVISIATNTAKDFRDSLVAASELTNKQKEMLIGVLDQYIDKLVQDDLASANLPNAVEQELYAGYVKSIGPNKANDKYLVEIQAESKNLASGNLSKDIVVELRNIFSGNLADLTSLLNNSSLGKALVMSPGSPSYAELIGEKIARAIDGKPLVTKTYKVSKTKVGSRTIKVIKPESNAKAISAAKSLKAKLKQGISKDSSILKLAQSGSLSSAASLEAILRENINDRVKANMGTGSSREVLNYRTGRIAESVGISKVSESRAGLISVFYSYMKNPYATFSEGGRQQNPRSRDPKKLISKSIRDIAIPLVGNRLRAVNVQKNFNC